MDPIQNFKTLSTKVVDELKEDLKAIRTGRASPSLVENIEVVAYGGQSKLKILELASILTDSPTSLVISPYDPSVLQDIEKAILKSPLGISPVVQGTKIILRVPMLSEEQREKYIKICHQKIEERKVMIRNNRDNTRKSIKTSFEKKETTEDDKFRLEKEIDTVTQTFMSEIEIIKEKKEKEIREV